MLTVEDGTGLANADSLASVADADAFHVQEGNAAWALLDLYAKEEHLRKATRFFCARFRDRLPGLRYKLQQALDLPRTMAFDRDGWVLPLGVVWQPVKDAVCLLALKSSQKPLAPDIDRDSYLVGRSLQLGSGFVNSRSFGVRRQVQPAYPEVDILLRRVLLPAGQLLRA